MKCECCGADFVATARLGGKPSRYCSRRCNARAWARRKIGFKPPEPRSCSVCKATFTPDNFHRGAQTCSSKCVDRSYFLRNRTSILTSLAAWLRLNPHKRRQYQRAYYWRHVETKREQARVRRSAHLSVQQFHFLCWTWAYRCAACDELFPPQRLTVDHRVALARAGTHRHSNLQPMCLPCNQSKGAR
jgi:hypothetical protein